MAEVIIGVVASSFAVASLAIQLVEIAQELHEFWQTYEDVDSDVERIKNHLSILQAISTSVADICTENPDMKCGNEVFRSLEVCTTRLEKLSGYTKSSRLGKKLVRTRKYWSALKWTVKAKATRVVESQLRGDVMILLLALQPFFQ
jgi:hypothetical protein